MRQVLYRRGVHRSRGVVTLHRVGLALHTPITAEPAGREILRTRQIRAEVPLATTLKNGYSARSRCLEAPLGRDPAIERVKDLGVLHCRCACACQRLSRLVN